MDSIISTMKRAIIAQSKAYPQKNFSEYMIRRIEHRLDSSKLPSLSESEKNDLANSLQAELDQLKRMTNVAGSLGMPEDFQTILEAKDAQVKEK